MNILITGNWDGASKLPEKLSELGYVCKYSKWENKQLPCEESWADIVICGNLFVYHDIRKFTKLKFIQSASTGLNQFPLEYINQHNIIIKNSKGAYSIPISEFAIMGILELCKHSKIFYKNQENHIWKKDRNLIELSGKNVCIVGCGSIGGQIAKRLKAFGCNIYGIRKTPKDAKYFDKIHTLNNLADILQESEIIIIALPLNDETFHLFDNNIFSNINDNSIFVNVSRGQIVDTSALLKNLDRFQGAVLDVFEDEPLSSNSELWDKDNVIIYPHNSFVSNKNADRLYNIFVKNLKGINLG